MIHLKDVDLNNLSKKFIDGAWVGHNKTIFFLAFSTGDELHGFCITPEQMKLTQIMLNTNIALFEKEHGVIDPDKIPKVGEPIISPIQMNSLGGGADEGNKNG